jgi:hypothetical protein
MEQINNISYHHSHHYDVTITIIFIIKIISSSTTPLLESTWLPFDFNVMFIFLNDIDNGLMTSSYSKPFIVDRSLLMRSFTVSTVT